MSKEKLKKSATKSIKMMSRMVPIIVGVVLLISLAIVSVPKSLYAVVFSGNFVIDPIIGALGGSVAAGNPVTSYIIGGELLKQGVSMIAVTAFIVAWVTVGLVQLPAEAMLLGKKFAIVRNVVALVFSIIVAIVTAGIMVMLG